MATITTSMISAIAAIDAPCYKLAHPSLGDINGISRGSEVVQFRGIRYASIPGRFRQSVLRTSLPQEPFDAIEPGPTCPHSQVGVFPQFWSGPLAPDGIQLSVSPADEFECLNLNITTTRSAIEENKKLPVLVFIHGGAFKVGSSSIQVSGREVYDGLRLVEASAALGQPLVVVTINYRVGPLGFLASRELADYNRQHNEAVGNYGLHDQRQALEWVQSFIAGFGGSPDEITIAGGSAGGASCHFQATFPNTRAKRAILCSGTTLAIGAMPLEYHQRRFDLLADTHSSTTGKGRLESLLTVAPEVLVEESMTGFYNPVIDDDWIKGRGLATLLQNPTSVELLIGSCAYEVLIPASPLATLQLTSPKARSHHRHAVRPHHRRRPHIHDPVHARADRPDHQNQ
jgi:carboxylesterase type B